MSHLKEKILVEGGKESPLAAHEMQMLAVRKASSINMGRPLGFSSCGFPGGLGFASVRARCGGGAAA